jgi:hypothetical protein
MKQIRLGGKHSDKQAIVDDEYYDILNKYKWCATNKNYAMTSFSCLHNRKKTIYLHQMVKTLSLNLPDVCLCDTSYRLQDTACEIDHTNSNPLDNRLENLEYVTKSFNGSKQGLRLGLSSKYNGVSWAKDKKKWQVYYWYNKKKKHIGYFENTPAGEIEAAKAHDETCRQLGLDRMLNFP